MARKNRDEVLAGDRFAFGRNWSSFLGTLDETRIANAEKSLLEKLEVRDLAGRSFIDIGSGSGLFSLAARRLGARVHSFDFDPHSVACALELKRRYFPDDPLWTIEEGSALDTTYLNGLGQFDIVYSWGVLHHTGAMWDALDNVSRSVAPGGCLFIAIYNDQGTASHRWRSVKKLYNRLPPAFRFLVLGPCAVVLTWRRVAKDCLRLQPLRFFTEYKQRRGMSYWYDLIDWVGGYPFEVATPKAIFEFYKAKGFTLSWLETCGGTLGCNQFVFRIGDRGGA